MEADKRMQASRSEESRSILIAYLAVTAVFSVALFYPAMVYYDLAGMGGYDGFASPEMMLKHGAWAPATSGHTFVYHAFEALALLWLLALMNLPVAALAVIRHSIRRRKALDGE